MTTQPSAPENFWPAHHAPSVLLIGDTGSGKSHSIRTIANYGLETFVLITEPNGQDVLTDIPCPKLHWRTVTMADPSWEAMLDAAKKINTMSYEDLSKLKSGVNKKEYDQFMDVLSTLANFKCDRCGKEFGPVDSWDSHRALVVDSLSGLNVMAKDLMNGAKPVAAMGEWGVAMDNLERLINKLTSATKCLFVLTSHVARVDDVVGGSRIGPSALGNKLGPKLPRFFSDVIYTDRTGTKFVWSTLSNTIITKPRHLPFSENLPPDFGPLMEEWKKRAEKANAAATPPTTA